MGDRESAGQVNCSHYLGSPTKQPLTAPASTGQTQSPSMSASGGLSGRQRMAPTCLQPSSAVGADGEQGSGCLFSLGKVLRQGCALRGDAPVFFVQSMVGSLRLKARRSGSQPRSMGGTVLDLGSWTLLAPREIIETWDMTWGPLSDTGLLI